MAEYRPKARWSDELECELDDLRLITGYEADDGVPTGLLDAQGNALFRYDRVKMGFLARG